MAYNTVYKESVQRDLRRLSKAEAHRVLKQIEEELSKNADTYPVLKGQFKGLRRHRIGDDRVVCAILENEVVVLRISHREQVYKKKI